MSDFRRATVFCLRCCLLKHKMTRYSKIFGEAMTPCPLLATPIDVRFIWCICNVNTSCKHLRIYITLGPYFFYIKTCLLEVWFIVKYTHSDCPNSVKSALHLIFSSLSLCKEWFNWRLSKKFTPMNVSVLGTTDQKHTWRNLGGGFSPLSPPLDPPMQIQQVRLGEGLSNM